MNWLTKIKDFLLTKHNEGKNVSDITPTQTAETTVTTADTTTTVTPAVTTVDQPSVVSVATSDVDAILAKVKAFLIADGVDVADSFDDIAALAKKRVSSL